MRYTETLSTQTARPGRLALIAGAAAAVLSVVGLFVSGAGLFFQAYLYAYLFWFGISLGLLAFLLLHFLTGSRWGLALRRVAEAGAANLWVTALLFIPLVFGIPYLYPWAQPGAIPDVHGMEFKAAYLTTPGWIIRAVIFFAVWIVLALVVNRNAARLAEAGPVEEPRIRARLQGLGAGGLILYVLTMTLASIDWLMSLHPLWTSTIFGLMIIVGQILTALAFGVLMLNAFPSLTQGRRWTGTATPIPYRDLGALMLTMVMGFAYMAFFQFLIMWAGNIPREAVWYLARGEGGWGVVAVILAVFQFALPFAILLSIRARYNLKVLAGLGAMLLLVYLLNMFWHVKPAFSPGVFTFSWLDIILPVAIGGIWLFAFFYHLARRPALRPVEEAALGLSETTHHPVAS